jgi:AraC family transcriptional regulator of arabinose operon
MITNKKSLWSSYIADAQLNLLIATYTKVPQTWKDYDYTPDFNKLYFITEGEGYIKVGDQEFYPKPGELYLLPAGVIQSYGTINEHTFGKYWCHFSSKLGELSLFDVVEASPYVTIQNTDEMTGHFQRLIHHHKSNDFTAGFRIRAILLEIIATYLELSETVKLNTKTSSTFEKMSSVLKHIEDHLASHITIEELAQLAHFQPNYFIHVFKSFTGISPIQYINRMRMEKAGQLLLFTPMNISAIAESLGLELSYFSRMFKEHTGYSPSTYRELMLQT